MPLKKDQQISLSFYPSEPFKNGHFNVRHPVSNTLEKLCKTICMYFISGEFVLPTSKNDNCENEDFCGSGSRDLSQFLQKSFM